MPRLRGSTEGLSFRRTPKTRHLAGQNIFLEILPNCHFLKLSGLYRAPEFLKLKKISFCSFLFLGWQESRPPGGLGEGRPWCQNPLNYAFSPNTTPIIVQATRAVAVARSSWFARPEGGSM
jgi:hypothetical protein